MALDILEWGVILVMGAGILVYGPEKIPEIAKTVAAAKKQFDGATKQLQGITKELQTGMNTGNLNIDTLSNALINVGGGTPMPSNPSPQGTAKASQGAPSGVAPAAAAAAAGAPAEGSGKSADQMLVEMAKSLSIQTQGRTREEISQAIMDRVETKPVPQPAPAAAAEPPAESGAAVASAESPQPAASDEPKGPSAQPSASQ
ncbi:MAG: twin-arginine translocase TatA/TatE family subunit [Nitrososphaerales archaeon]|jgi:Sec-independent protein translocase protein TatA